MQAIYLENVSDLTSEPFLLQPCIGSLLVMVTHHSSGVTTTQTFLVPIKGCSKISFIKGLKNYCLQILLLHKSSDDIFQSVVFFSLASHTLLAKNKAEGSGDHACNVSCHSPCIDGKTYFMCTCLCEGFRL